MASSMFFMKIKVSSARTETQKQLKKLLKIKYLTTFIFNMKNTMACYLERGRKVTWNKSVVQTTHLRGGNESSLAIVIESSIKIG